MENYIPGKGILVGTYTLSDIEIGLDRADVAVAMERTGLKYTNTKIIKKNGKPVSLRIWVCTAEDFEI